MGCAPCCGDHEGLKRGPWTAEEDQKLIHYVQSHGLGNWRTVPKLSGLSRCGKSCRLRWANYLRPDIKRGPFSMHEDLTIIRLHAVLGNKWSVIASNLPGRTDNEVKNHWNTKLKKRLLLMGIDPVTHMSLPTPDMLSCLMASSSTAIAVPLNNALAEAQLGQLVRDCENITHPVSTGSGYEYSWQLSPILHLLAMHNNPLWTHPSESLTSVVPMDLSTLDWNSMPNLMPSNIPDHKNDHRYCYVSNKKSSSTTISSSYKGGSEIPENTIHYHRDDTFGSAIRTARSDQRLEEDESSYWLRLLNSIDDSNGDPTNYIKLHLPSP